MSCDEKLESLNESWDALNDARDAFGEAASAVQEALDQAEHLCGYDSGTGFVIDPLEPGEPDFPPGSPTCLEALALWWDEYLNVLPLHYDVVALEAATWEQYETWAACMHEHPGMEGI